VDIDEQDFLRATLLPSVQDRVNKLKNTEFKLAQYMSAAVFIQMLKNRNIWMRNARVMNDFSEIHHGQNCLFSAWKDPKLKRRLRQCLGENSDEVMAQLEIVFDQHQWGRTEQTYLACFTEHDTKSEENLYGRLSMWRAYGGETNVAVVMNSEPFFANNGQTSIFVTPVSYCTIEQFKNYFELFLSGLEKESDFFSNLNSDTMIEIIFTIFHFWTVSIKHPGFAEEREWRVIASPTVFGKDRLDLDIEEVGGVPQPVYKILLENDETNGVIGLEPSELISRVIIGPNQSPQVMLNAITVKMNEAGISDAFDRIQVSDIPLRR